MIDLFRPYIPEGVVAKVTEVLRSRQLAQGPMVDQFEQRFSRLFDVKYPVALNSGTASLNMAYDLVGLKKGDEVISTPLTCTATNLPLIRRGCKIIWADITDNLTIDPFDVRAKITENTKAIIQVHLGGIKADVGAVHLPVISDAAQALGIFNGDYTCCSFQAIKHITTGDGGMIVLNNEPEYEKAKLLRWFGIDRSRTFSKDWESYKERMMSFDIDLPGDKMHMNDIAAAMGLVGLEHYYEMHEYRKWLFNIYRNKLSGIDGIRLVDSKENAYWLVTVIVERRDDFAKMLFENNIDCNIVQVRNDTYKIFGGRVYDLPKMDELEEKYISLPLGMHIEESDVMHICDLIKKGW